jgi:hypothetical protein
MKAVRSRRYAGGFLAQAQTNGHAMRTIRDSSLSHLLAFIIQDTNFQRLLG